MVEDSFRRAVIGCGTTEGSQGILSHSAARVQDRQ
jgi:hypothetical protein